MALYTSEYLKSRAQRNSYVLESKIFSERKKKHTSFDIFLSHSFLDKDEVEGLYDELTSMGFSVYLDWIIDPHLDRNNVTKESAELIRNRMRMSKTLLLAISDNAAMSKWIPWELGYVDGNTNKCAIVPVSKSFNSATEFKRIEYLLLYPYIKRAEIGSTTDAYLVESNNRYVKLTDWLRNDTQPSYKERNIDFL